ncbi:MAG TPA: UBP-type zinc finger domain-containing protein [Acidimicrobiia bacterium]
MATDTCTHLDQIGNVEPRAVGCEECLATGQRWMHLRLCMTCGHVGCCDNSPGRHATKHFHASAHPIIQSFEPGEEWWWCYVDELAFELADAPSFAHP